MQESVTALGRVKVGALSELFAEAATLAVARFVTGGARPFVWALSGGSTPWRLLERLAVHDLPWPHVHIVQVDERVAPDGDPAAILHALRQRIDPVFLPRPLILVEALPRNDTGKLPRAALLALYARTHGKGPA